MSVMKEVVAGAARSLWMDLVGPEDGLQEKLNGAFGATIVYSEAMQKLGDRFAGLSPAGFAVLSQQRWRAAEAAKYLFTIHGTDSGWLAGSRAGQIIDVFEKVRGAVPRDSSVADAALWLYHNRGARLQTLAFKSGAIILQIYLACKSSDDARARTAWDERKYSLSDLRRAYDMGFGNSSEGWNQEIHPDYLDKENYQAERHEALREFN